MCKKGVEGAEVGRNGVVVVEAVHHQRQVTPLLWDRQLLIRRRVGLTSRSLALQPLAHGMPPDQSPMRTPYGPGVSIPTDNGAEIEALAASNPDFAAWGQTSPTRSPC
jgi:hypothetical protein